MLSYRLTDDIFSKLGVIFCCSISSSSGFKSPSTSALTKVSIYRLYNIRRHSKIYFSTIIQYIFLFTYWRYSTIRTLSKLKTISKYKVQTPKKEKCVKQYFENWMDHENEIGKPSFLSYLITINIRNECLTRFEKYIEVIPSDHYYKQNSTF